MDGSFNWAGRPAGKWAGRPAGFFLRAIAAMLDLSLVLLLTWPLGLLLVRTPNPSDEQDQLMMLFMGISAIYSIGFTLKWGGTLGKLLLKMRVVQMHDGERIAWYQALVRWMSYVLSASIFGAGFLMAAFHPYKRTIHDLMASTRVIRLSSARQDK